MNIYLLSQKYPQKRAFITGAAAGLGKAFTYLLAVSEKDQYKEVVERFLFYAEGIDLLFNNAGVVDGSGFETNSLENYEWMVGINQMGVLYSCWYFIPAMKMQGYGPIFNTASAAAISCDPTMGGYNMTKADGFGRHLGLLV